MAIQTDKTFQAGRVSVRPLEYVGASGTVYGHYRAVAKSGATNSIGAGTSGILASLRWSDASRYLVLHRLAMIAEVTAAITTAAPIDAQAFVFRNSTGNSSGAGSTTLSGGASQKNRAVFGPSLLLANGEIRTVGTTTALTASAGKTNDGAPFGVAMFGTQIAPNVGATANVTAPIAALVTGWQDLYSLQSPYQHPIVLANNEGVEIQTITAGPTTGAVQYAFLWEWSEVEAF